MENISGTARHRGAVLYQSPIVNAGGDIVLLTKA